MSEGRGGKLSFRGFFIMRFRRYSDANELRVKRRSKILGILRGFRKCRIKNPGACYKESSRFARNFLLATIISSLQHMRRNRGVFLLFSKCDGFRMVYYANFLVGIDFGDYFSCERIGQACAII